MRRTQGRTLVMQASDAHLFRRAIREWSRGNVATVIELLEPQGETKRLGGPLELLLAEALKDLAQYQRAEKILAPYVQRGSDVRFWRAMGELLQQRGDLRGAVRWFSRCARSQPDNATNWIYQGAALALMGRVKEAETCHRRATRCREGALDEAWLNVGLCLRAQRRYSEAAVCLRRALRMDPKYKAARAALRDVETAQILLASGTVTGSGKPHTTMRSRKVSR